MNLLGLCLLLILPLLPTNSIMAQSTFLINNDSVVFNQIDKATEQKYNEIIKTGKVSLIQGPNNTLEIKFDPETEIAIQKILDENMRDKMFYERYGTTDIEAFENDLRQSYLDFKEYGLSGKPYAVDYDFKYNRYPTQHVADKTRVDDQHVRAQVELFYVHNLLMIEALKDPETFTNDFLYNLPSFSAIEAGAMTELLSQRMLKVETVKEVISVCYSLLRNLNDKMEEDQSMSFNDWRDRKGKDINRYVNAFVDVFNYGYWKLEPRYNIDGEVLINLIAAASAGYGFDILDFENQKDYTDFQRIDELLTELDVDIDSNPDLKSYVDGLKQEYYQKYYSEGAPELFKNSRKTNEQKQEELLSELKLIDPLVSGTKPVMSSKYKILKLFGSFADRDDDLGKVALSYLSNIIHIDNIEYLMALANYDPTIGQARELSVVNTQYFEKREVEKTQAYAVLALSNMYRSLNSKTEPVLRLYIEDFLKREVDASNKSSANIAAEALGISVPYPKHETYSSLTDIGLMLRDFTFVTASSTKLFSLPKWARFGSKATGTSNIIKGSQVFSEFTSMSINIPTVISPLKAASSIPGVTSAVWQLPSVLLNSSKTMDAIFLMTRIINTAAIVKTELGTLYIDQKNKQILLEADTKIAEIDKIKQNALLVQVSIGGVSYQYIIGITKQAQLEDIKEHLRLISLANPDMTVSFYDGKTEPFKNASMLKDLPIQTETLISDLLNNAGVSSVDQTAIINAFKNGMSFSAPGIMNMMLDGNSIAVNVGVTISTDGSIVLDIARVFGSAAEMLEYHRVFKRDFTSGAVTEEAYSYSQSRKIPISLDLAAEFDAMVANYNSFCKEL